MWWTEEEGIPLGTKRMSSHHIIGRLEYLLVLRNPISTALRGASPHRSRFWASLNEGLASTR